MLVNNDLSWHGLPLGRLNSPEIIFELLSTQVDTLLIKSVTVKLNQYHIRLYRRLHQIMRTQNICLRLQLRLDHNCMASVDHTAVHRYSSVRSPTWELPGCLCVFVVFIVSKDTQSNLSFFEGKPFFLMCMVGHC